MVLETLLPLDKVDRRLRAPEMPLDVHSIAADARLLQEIGYDGLAKARRSDGTVALQWCCRIISTAGSVRASPRLSWLTAAVTGSSMGWYSRVTPRRSGAACGRTSRPAPRDRMLAALAET
jgi:hypothetical protein